MEFAKTIIESKISELRDRQYDDDALKSLLTNQPMLEVARQKFSEMIEQAHTLSIPRNFTIPVTGYSISGHTVHFQFVYNYDPFNRNLNLTSILGRLNNVKQRYKIENPNDIPTPKQVHENLWQIMQDKNATKMLAIEAKQQTQNLDPAESFLKPFKLISNILTSQGYTDISSPGFNLLDNIRDEFKKTLFKLVEFKDSVSFFGETKGKMPDTNEEIYLKFNFTYQPDTLDISIAALYAITGSKERIYHFEQTQDLNTLKQIWDDLKTYQAKSITAQLKGHSSKQNRNKP